MIDTLDALGQIGDRVCEVFRGNVLRLTDCFIKSTCSICRHSGVYWSVAYRCEVVSAIKPSLSFLMHAIVPLPLLVIG